MPYRGINHPVDHTLSQTGNLLTLVLRAPVAVMGPGIAATDEDRVIAGDAFVT